jgi:acyl transferase domain-containing protein/thioesterase domain-containing protein/aryl carrier-like protein
MHMHRPAPQPDALPDDTLDTAIAVVGMACRFAGARSPGEYWANLRAGTEAVRSYSDEELIAAGVDAGTLRDPDYVRSSAPLDDMECFDAALFGLSPRDASIMDPQHRHFLECAWEALEDAGHTPARFSGAIGVFGGSGHNAYLARNLLSNPKLVRSVGAFLLRHTGNDKDFLTTRASYLLDLRGPSVAVQTACSTSLVAVHMAVQHLLGGECDMALAGGVSIELPHRHGYRYEEGEILSPDGHCRPFDADSKGTIFGSGVGIVALRRLRDAIADGDHIHALIRGSAVNNDGSGKVGYLAPSVDGQASVVTEALGVAGVDARTIGYLEAHGTGTPVGDPIEVAALTQAYRRDTDDVGYCAIGSVKGNIGHTDTAAGTASLIKVALALRACEIPPTLGYAAPNPACDFGKSPFRVNGALTPWPRPADAPRRAGVSSLGVGGTNAHLVMEEAPERVPSGPSRSHQLLTLSARSAGALEANGSALAAHFAGDPSVDLADAAYTLNIGRQPLGRRRVVVAESTADAAAALAGPDRGLASEALADRAVAFMFCGAGSQYAGMGVGLYAGEPIFRAAVDECLAAADDPELRRWLFPVPADAAEAARQLERPSVALPALFTIQVALARLWMAWGIRPNGMIGHSSGEYAAAHLAGVIGLSDALRVVATRGRLFETLPEGGMLSVPMSEADLRPLLPADVSIAAINGAELCIASGAVDAIGRLEAALTARGTETRRVRIAVAAHSPMLDPVLDAFRACLKTVRLAAPTLPFVSNLTGLPITPAEATDPEYWVRHLRQTVRFTDGLNQLVGDETRVLLEVGPGRTMASLARQHPERAKGQPVLNSMRHPDEKADDTAYLLETLGRLWTLGAPVDWDRFWAGQRRLRVPLPTYRFDRERHWIEPGVAAMRDEASSDDPPRRHADVADWFYEPVWRRTAAARPGVHPGAALVFEGTTGLGAVLAERLRLAGRTVATVRFGRRFASRGDAFTIDARRPEDYRRLVAELAAEDRWPEQVYHCGLVTGGPEGGDPVRAAAAMQDHGLYGLMFLLQALAEEDRGAPIRIAAITDGMQRVSDEGWIEPAKATMLGACRVAGREFPGMTVRSIDVIPTETGAPMSRLAELILAEVAGGDDAEAVAFRAGERWVQSFEPASRAEAGAGGDGGVRLRANGAYLITGGLGGIGLTLARHLAEECGARIALLSRTALPPRNSWSDQLAARPAGDPVRERIREVLEVEAAGGEVLLVEADVADPRAVRRAVKRTQARFGRIDGVFHAAGVLDDGLIQLKTARAAAAVLAPKLFGTLVLEAALRRDPPDFTVLFSSISAFAGLVGQFDYAAANAFLDAYAQSRRDGTNGRMVSVGWSQWQGVGMAAALAGAGSEPEPTDAGLPVDHPFLDTVHTLSADEVVVASRLSPDRHWLLDEHRLAGGGALIPGTGFLELVRAAHAEIAPGPVELADIAFVAPFAVPEGAERDLRVRLRRDGGEWRFVVLGRAVGADEQGWTEHVRGTIRPLTDGDPAPLALDATRARCAAPAPSPADVEGSPFLRFGPRWRTVRAVAFGGAEALIELALAPAFAGDLERLALHPALLDFATAGAQALIPGHDPRAAFFAPMSYGRVRISAPLPAMVFSHIRLRADAYDNAALAVFDVTIVDAAGTVLVDIEGFTMIRVRDPALLAAAMPRAAGTGPAGGLTAREGMRVLDRVLAGPDRPHLVISPEPLIPAIARLRPAPKTPSAARADGDLEAGPPRTPAERLIAEMWGEMLGVDGVRFDDDFFDLGGHSLLAVQFTNRWRKRTGAALPLAALLETPTVERLAAFVDREGAASAAFGPPLTRAADVEGAAPPPAPGTVTLRAGGNAPPLFLVHDGLGETMLYRSLALRLEPGRPVHGLEPERLADGSFAHHSISAMAAAYIERIRRVRPDGPYLLGGLCAGGVIAFEMARQLRDAGAAVPFVGILDAADVEASGRRLYVASARWDRVRRTLRPGSVGDVATLLPALLRKAANAASWEITSRLDRFRRARLVAGMGAAGNAPAGRAPSLTFLQLYEAAHRAHRPEGLFAGGDVVLFRATAGNGAEDDIPFGEKYSDCILGWGRRVADDVILVRVPGGHTSLLQTPHVEVLAGALQRAIDAATARWSADPQPAADRPSDKAIEPVLVA